MIKIDWDNDYRQEFKCPHCQKQGMKIRQKRSGRSGNKKLQFECLSCKKTSFGSLDLTLINISRYRKAKSKVKAFCFEDNQWDLRAINTSVNNNSPRYLIYFDSLNISWFKTLIKQYILHLCKLNKPYTTIDGAMIVYRQFSRYLIEKEISDITIINRGLIIDFMTWGNNTNEVITKRLRNLRQFFTYGNLQGWFQIDPDIIRDSDYPKRTYNNPDPIPDVVREQIEKNLHKLPNPIARMWIICFFTAMRPYELALLKKDCLEQVGDKWKLVWWRKKGKKFHQHSVPITTTIAKVVQEQLEYIEDLWGKDWEYLFCHYHNISQSDPTHPRLKAVKKVIPSNLSPLQIAIRTLIKSENILDDNGELGKFEQRLIRETRLTELFLKGHDLSVVSAWAGHRQLATTANFYTQVTCEQIEKEVGHIQSALVNADGKKIYYESMPKSFWDNPVAHELEVAGTHVNTPIYGYCGLDLDEECDKFRACYTCRFFVAKPEKLSQYVNLRDELREKQERALANGHGVLVEQFARQADQLDKIILSLQEAA